MDIDFFVRFFFTGVVMAFVTVAVIWMEPEEKESKFPNTTRYVLMLILLFSFAAAALGILGIVWTI